MSKDMTLEALERWMNSQESIDMFGEDDSAAEEYFWENLDSKFADWC